jgi:phosphoribosylanthranilate isomerase
VFVKICGITTEDDALLAVAMGADALGFNFAPGSRRQVTVETARDIVKRLPAGTVTVGVFRDERPERVVEVVSKVGLTGAQLHGREPISEVRWVRQRVTFVIQAFAAGDPSLQAAANGPADVILVAGGLTAENVGDAIRRIRPWGVDVATGVESSPGRKDPGKLRRFIAAAHDIGDDVADDERPPAPVEGPYDWEIDELAGH